MSETIADLGRLMRDMARRHSKLDRASLRAPTAAAREAADTERDATLDTILDIQGRIMALPAQNLEDAAVQAAVAYLWAEGLDVHDGAQSREIDGIKFATLSVMGAIAKAAGIELSRLGWGQWRHIGAGIGLDLADVA